MEIWLFSYHLDEQHSISKETSEVDNADSSPKYECNKFEPKFGDTCNNQNSLIRMRQVLTKICEYKNSYAEYQGKLNP